MSCEKHPNRNSVANCQFCGKELCEECAINIAGKNYCEDCMSELVGPELASIASNKHDDGHREQKNAINSENNQIPAEQDPYQTEKIRNPTEEKNFADEDYLNNSPTQQNPEGSNENYDDLYGDDRLYNDTRENKDHITPDKKIEDKYEKYLDDLYYDEKPQKTNMHENDQIGIERELSLSDQLAMDEAKHGSITKEPFIQEKPTNKQNEFEDYGNQNKSVPIMENLRNENSNIQQNKNNDEYTPASLHRKNIHYKKQEKKPFTSTETVLTAILILLIIFVVIYVVYLLTLHSQYPNILDAINSLF